MPASRSCAAAGRHRDRELQPRQELAADYSSHEVPYVPGGERGRSSPLTTPHTKYSMYRGAKSGLLLLTYATLTRGKEVSTYLLLLGRVQLVADCPSTHCKQPSIKFVGNLFGCSNGFNDSGQFAEL